MYCKGVCVCVHVCCVWSYMNGLVCYMSSFYCKELLNFVESNYEYNIAAYSYNAMSIVLRMVEQTQV